MPLAEPHVHEIARYVGGMHSPSAPQHVRDELAHVMSGFHPVVIRTPAT